MANLPYTEGSNGNGIMDSFVVDPTDACTGFVTMLLERLDRLEGQVDGLEGENNRLNTEVARLTADNTTLKAELAAQPRPQAYYTWLRVPDNTSREQIEDGLKAVFTSMQLTTDGVFRTGFHVAVTTVEDIDSGAHLYKDAHVFVCGAMGITPLQAQTWATSAVQGSRLASTRGVRMIWQDAEVEWFMQQLRGDRTYVLYPRRDAWVEEEMEPLCDNDDDIDCEAWMEQTYVHGQPYVAIDGGVQLRAAHPTF
jgi:hypothetical protein